MDLEFMVGDFFYLQISLMRGEMRFGKKEKLSSQYVGSYEVVKRIKKFRMI